MKKITTSLFILFVIVSTTVYFTSCSSISGKESAKNENALGIPALLERKATLGPDGETESIKTTYDNAMASLKVNPADVKQYLTLATVFITEGRITGNGGYYSNAAFKMLNKVLEANPSDKDVLFQAYSLKSAVLLNMHQFKDALDVAQKGVALYDYNAGIYGALVDANVELGNYSEAVKNCDKMLSIRPDLRSYSRASYLRQIYGENAGAIQAMAMAVEAGVPGAENTEWARVQLGDLYLNTGKIDSAEYQYKTALTYRPNYAYAEMGLSKIQRAKKNYDEAIKHCEDAIRIVSESSFVTYLGDLYELKGDAKKSAEIRNDVVKLLQEAEKNQPKDAQIKHNGSRELATANININNLDKALQYAQNDLNMRPLNIDANELVAWIYFLKGDYTNAKIYADKLFVTNSKNQNTLYKAGLIYTKAGDAEKGSVLMAEAKTISPYIDQIIINRGNEQ